MRRLFLFLPIFLLLLSCSHDSLTPEPEPPVTNPEPEVSYPNLAYGAQTLQKMDVFLPAGRTVATTRTMVIIHGGAWTDGDKTDMAFVVDSLKKRLPTYAFININYRLANSGMTDLFPVQEQDVKAAIEFYLSKATTYQVSQNLIVLGASAGGHLALLHSYKNDPDKHVKAVVDLFGPADLVAMWNEGILQQLAMMMVTGKTYSQDAAIYTSSSPINYITPQSPPTIVFHGTADLIVNPVQSTMLVSKLVEKGVVNQLVQYPGEGHGFTTPTNSDAITKSLSFIAKNVK